MRRWVRSSELHEIWAKTAKWRTQFKKKVPVFKTGGKFQRKRFQNEIPEFATRSFIVPSDTTWEDLPVLKHPGKFGSNLHGKSGHVWVMYGLMYGQRWECHKMADSYDAGQPKTELQQRKLWVIFVIFPSKNFLLLTFHFARYVSKNIIANTNDWWLCIFEI